MAFAKYYRWSDDDRRAGPFIYARDRRGYRPLALVISSGRGEEPDSDAGCTLRMSAFGHTLIVALPQIIQPWKRWVDCSKYEWSTSETNGYWERHSREYGFSFSRSGDVGDSVFLQVFLGAQTHDSRTTQNWCTHLPWTQWRHVRHSMYGLDGEHFWTEPKRKKGERWDWEAWQTAKDACPSVTFAFKDFDGEKLTARTHIEEREWRFGSGWFKCLSVFRKPIVHRSLDISFSGETGERKGSWKGGTIGHSISMVPGELHEAAFRRYCAEHHMVFLSARSAASELDSEGA